MLLNDMTIPVGVSIRVDDVGWLDGRDERAYNRACRSQICRYHVPDDFRVLHEIGKGLGTKVLCNLVLGDWDIKNRLRGVPHLTWDEKGWDAASVIAKNRAYFDECFSVLEGSDHLEYGLHGIQHAYFENGVFKDTKYLYPFKGMDPHGVPIRLPLPAEEFDLMLDLFYEIYHDWGFKKDIHVFEAGSGCFGTPDAEYNRTFARILREHGIEIWEWAGWYGKATVQDGTVFLQSVGDASFVLWNAVAVDPSILHDCFVQDGVLNVRPNICGHVANFIQSQPEKNFDYVPAWIDYFRRVTSHFGAVLARDNEASASQTIYSRYAVVDRIEGGYRIDLAPVDAVRIPLVEDEFFISIKEKRLPRSVLGGSILLHEVRPDHTVYKIVRHQGAERVEILF